MEKVQSGNLTLLELLVRRYEKPLFAYAARVLDDRPAAEDAFQETFLRVFQKRHTYRIGHPFRPWIYRICLNTCRDWLRKQKRRSEEELVDQEAASNEAAVRIRAAVNALPEKMRDVFLLAHFHGFNYQEIGRILDVPEGTVKSRMFHATKRLQEELSEPPSPSAGPPPGSAH